MYIYMLPLPTAQSSSQAFAHCSKLPQPTDVVCVGGVPCLDSSNRQPENGSRGMMFVGWCEVHPCMIDASGSPKWHENGISDGYVCAMPSLSACVSPMNEPFGHEFCWFSGRFPRPKDYTWRRSRLDTIYDADLRRETAL